MRGEGSRWCLGSGAGLGLVALLLPKCPLCLAGYLALFGVGATAGIAIAELAAPAAIVLAVMMVGAASISWARDRRRTPTCCYATYRMPP
jgi:hypothetical protein